ncbi:hypothetical protein Kpol_1070p2 [Vanderwaltozyma polyspora DSM 70294]|uniref:glycerol kinase n=1 Tax=Vanderwaltozyma polyspora (strain ATCC 22028 / DSM 70294 / BCRC 21397 / CBS 2163 / NBRC 10782 / NRRL Y-8283 / UCD 57-17) TaxID=436907 RepID=A7TNK4_VANPO|nr:uncharacterized protein Kpol_1070p2 [Vanderwaltozyma polyspora DSM 70294]EDO16121.1 hypothetical protein Kpol_1070p2 [Vanderwaltozyma polyspora DSM 70294]
MVVTASPLFDSSSENIVPLVASIDVGTTSSRAILFNRLGQEVAKHQIEYSTTASKDKKKNQSQQKRPSVVGSVDMKKSVTEDQIFSAEGIAIKENEYLKIEELTDDVAEPTLRFPQPGWVECNPMNILTYVVECLATTFNTLDNLNKERSENNLPLYKITCMGVANMRETTLVWSKKTGMPIVDYGIVWNDTRNSKLVTDKKNATPEDVQQRLKDKTGLPIFSTYFSCSKLRWFLDNEPTVMDAYEAGDLMFGTIDTWILYSVTHNNAFVSDVTNASRTGFMNLDTIDYDEELITFWNIDPKKIHLPKIVSSAEYYGDFNINDCLYERLSENGKTYIERHRKCHPSIPLQGCLGDQSASLVGQMAFKPGSAKCTYGTGCFLLFNTGTKKLISKHGALTTFGYWFPYLNGEEQSQPHFALEGSIAVAGAVVQWLRDNLRMFPRAEDVGPMASQVKDSGGVVFVPAFSGLFAPYWDQDARATIMGMSQYTTASHIARAAVEGVCFQARAILKAMSSDAFGGDGDKDFLEEVSEEAYEQSPLSTLAVDGGMSRSDEVMQIQADILGPCIKIRRSPTHECTALGAAIAANMAFKDEKDRLLWKDLKDVKKWVYYGGHEKGDQIGADELNLKVFESESSDEERRSHWKLWEAAIERTKGWLSATEGL